MSRPSFDDMNRDARLQRGKDKDVRTHRHVPAKVDGNRVYCACGEVCGFLKDPKKGALA